MESRFIPGNFGEPTGAGGSARLPTGQKRLVEECQVVSIYGLQRNLGKKPLIAAIRECRPLRFRFRGLPFEAWLTDEPHRLPGKRESWSSLENGTVRLWLVCPGCRRTVAKLFWYELYPGSNVHSELRCRICHGLTYQSKNSSGNRWFLEVGRPLKALLRKRSRLLGVSPKSCARRAAIDREIDLLLERLLSERRQPSRQAQSRVRRPYRDIRPILRKGD